MPKPHVFLFSGLFIHGVAFCASFCVCREKQYVHRLLNFVNLFSIFFFHFSFRFSLYFRFVTLAFVVCYSPLLKLIHNYYFGLSTHKTAKKRRSEKRQTV